MEDFWEKDFKLIKDFKINIKEYINFLKSKDDIKEDYGKENRNIVNWDYNSYIITSGEFTKITNIFAGQFAKIISLGNLEKIINSQNYANIGSIGKYTNINNSGNNTKIICAGNYANISTSGDNVVINVLGKNSVISSSGYKTIIKGKNGTWFSLTEYGKNKKDNIIPSYIKVGQIGNKNYKDCKGRILKEDTYYIIWKNKFYPVTKINDMYIVILSEKNIKNTKIIKGINIKDIYTKNINEIDRTYILKQDNIIIYNKKLKQGLKELYNTKKEKEKTYYEGKKINKIIRKAKKQNKIAMKDYKIILNNYIYIKKINDFLSKNNIDEYKKIKLNELREILTDDIGAELFWFLIDNKIGE